MPYMIPGAAIGTGVALTIWGARRCIDGDDSADQAVAKVLCDVPDYITEHVEDVEVTSSGVTIKLRKDAPDSAVREAQRNIDIADRPDGVDVHR